MKNIDIYGWTTKGEAWRNVGEIEKERKEENLVSWLIGWEVDDDDFEDGK